MKAGVSITTIALLLLSSCSNKTPEDYGKEYCQCMKDNNGNIKKCKDILDEAKEEYGTDNKEAVAEFKSAAKECLVD